jgi:hypothetical protein
MATHLKERYRKGYADSELSSAVKNAIIVGAVTAVVIVLALLVWAMFSSGLLKAFY